MIGWSNLCLIRVLYSMGDMTGAEEIIQTMEDTARQHHVPLWITSPIAAWQARIWLAQDKLEAVSQWVDERELEPDEAPTFLGEMEYIAFARILLAQERLDEAEWLLDRLQAATEAGRRVSRLIEVMNLKALMYQAANDTDRAIHTLEQALMYGEPGGFMRTFIDEGSSMACLLYEALNRGIAPDYTRRLLAAFPITPTAPPTTQRETLAPKPVSSLRSGQAEKAVGGPGYFEPLSDREIEVLQLIAEGLTNKEIASRLYLSVNTVKVHNRNINGKLGVHRRTQAVARARTLGILPQSDFLTA